MVLEEQTEYPAQELIKCKVKVIFSNIKGCAEVGNNEFVIIPKRNDVGFSLGYQGELPLSIEEMPPCLRPIICLLVSVF